MFHSILIFDPEVELFMELPSSSIITGNHIIAIVKAKDDYASVRDSLIELRQEMKNLSEISVNGANYKIEYVIGGDWKFLATVCGIGPAIHNYTWNGATVQNFKGGLLPKLGSLKGVLQTLKKIQRQESSIISFSHFLTL